MAKPIRVLVVDDSPLIRQLLTSMLSEENTGIEVVGTAADPFIARDKIKQLRPDVITLDVEMPRMTGLQFLKNLMRLYPMPVVMVSSLTEQGAPETLDALELGAVDYIAKPQIKNEAAFKRFAKHLVEKITIASTAKVRILETEKVQQRRSQVETVQSYHRWIAIGASTGGTEAIKEVLMTVPKHCPPIVITQHIPAVFSRSFAMRLNHSLELEVCEAENGLEVLPGRVIIAEGDHHLEFIKQQGKTVCQLSASEPVNRHRPSVGVMFDSLRTVITPSKLVVVLLTGMGNDGASALARLKQEGASTLVQDEASSVVWGMPGAAVAQGAVDEVVPLSEVARRMLSLAAVKQ
ncbi:chemotaxis response regulator protein-glutamate methylesterase [Bacterioplanes sanyensis]|uniref:Protein-glutamate methylesterase/protein-glutamine glutaminase n=1 Tax=Bacterioplanes sanyensis TaxID=1249553 RepID=A0A222FNI8_9GAMM|nr:chemotaxis response regulator protein-glutamate methylesterase [Bacterioplanes sanyensis]ASP40588.1 chemotaxis response regulator protein-glutamate methylesterase [Bacterioplanes sanyensis]